jgi:hypothetical protein
MPRTKPLYLPLDDASEDDPIGFNNVNGFYGPGAWFAWASLICTTYYRLFKPGRSGTDSNTSMFILTLNYAAVDMILHIRAMDNSKTSGSVEWMKEGACIGAALLIVWWGTFHAIVQSLYEILALKSAPQNAPRNAQRLYLQLFGMLLPLISLTVFSFYCASPDLLWNDDHIAHKIPAFYWSGMAAESHDNSMIIISFTGPLFLLALLVGVGYEIWSSLPDESTFKVGVAGFSLLILNLWLCNVLVGSLILIVLAHTGHTDYILYLAFTIPPVTVIGTGCALWFQVLFIIGGPVAYIITAYLAQRIAWSQKCFFMPCAPQSILELDQACAFTGGILLIFMEFNVMRRFRKAAWGVARKVFQRGH